MAFVTCRHRDGLGNEQRDSDAFWQPHGKRLRHKLADCLAHANSVLNWHRYRVDDRLTHSVQHSDSDGKSYRVRDDLINCNVLCYIDKHEHRDSNQLSNAVCNCIHDCD